MDGPVVAGPVEVRGVNLKDEVIYEHGDIELAGDIIIIGGIGEVVGV